MGQTLSEPVVEKVREEKTRETERVKESEGEGITPKQPHADRPTTRRDGHGERHRRTGEGTS